MNLYLDSSSLLKLYLAEDGSFAVEHLVDAAETVSTSLVAYAEARSGLVRARRAGRLADVGYRRARAEFEGQWSSFSVQPVSATLVQLAGDLAEKHILRGFAAVHLASALALQTELAEPITFSASDTRLMSAADAEGLTIPQA